MGILDVAHYVERAKSSWPLTRSCPSPRIWGTQQSASLLTMSPLRDRFEVFDQCKHSMGLPTRISTSKIADHSNALAENAVNRVRGLAGTFMDEVQTKIGMKLQHQQHDLELGCKACSLDPQQVSCSSRSNTL